MLDFMLYQLSKQNQVIKLLNYLFNYLYYQNYNLQSYNYYNPIHHYFKNYLFNYYRSFNYYQMFNYNQMLNYYQLFNFVHYLQFNLNYYYYFNCCLLYHLMNYYLYQMKYHEYDHSFKFLNLNYFVLVNYDDNHHLPFLINLHLFNLRFLIFDLKSLNEAEL